MADPLVIEQARVFKARVLLREEASTQALVSRWSQVEQALGTHVDALVNRALAVSAGQRIPVSVLYHLERYQEFQAQAIDVILAYQAYAEGRIDESVRSQAIFGITDGTQLIGIQATPFGISFNILPVDAINEIIALTEIEPVAEVLARMAPLGIGAATQILIQNTAMGINPRRTAREMFAQGLSQSLNQAVLVNRDLQLRAYRNGSLEQYRASGIVDQFQRTATKDSRVCPACLSKDGERQDVADLMALHTQDRCSVIPIIRGLPEFTYTNAQDWFAEQPPGVQMEILGQGRYRLYAAGQATLSDFAAVHQDPTWGPQLKTVPLNQLRRN